MVIFHSHVSLPEGNICSPLNLQFWPIHMTIDFQLPGWLLCWADGNWEIGFGPVSHGCSCFCSHFSYTKWRIQWCLSRILMAYVRTHKYHQISMHVDAMLRKKNARPELLTSLAIYLFAWINTHSCLLNCQTLRSWLILVPALRIAIHDIDWVQSLAGWIHWIFTMMLLNCSESVTFCQ
jgi:hypothetical protein